MRKKLLVILFSVFTVFVLASNNVFADEHNHTDWTVWGDDPSEWTSLPSGAGNYFLTCDVTLSETWNVPVGTNNEHAVTNLCLNGHVIKFASESGSVINVSYYAELNLYDCNTTTVHNGYVDANGLWHLDANEGHILLEGEIKKDITGGIITGGTAVHVGGVYVNSGTFNMYGGSIIGNEASYGGGMGVTGTFNMYGGKITNNYAKELGGGINLNGTFNMYGGEITNNETANNKNGGGVYANRGTFTMTDGTITSNKAEHGGGIFVASDAQTIITNGIIENNHATQAGAGVQVDGSFTMTGGTIKNNKADGNGGGLSVNGTAKLIGTAKIINNTAHNNYQGGGVNYYGGSLTIGGSAQITGNVNGGTITIDGLTGGTANNVCLYYADKYITLGSNDDAPMDGMLVGVTKAISAGNKSVVIIENATADDAEYFTSDNVNCKIQYNNTSDCLELVNVTIADVLATVPGGFPTTSSSGWVAQDGSKIYIDGDNLISSVSMPLNSVLTPDGDKYSIIPSLGYTYIFVMQSGALSRIDKLPPLGQTVSYYPYAFTNPPRSVSGGDIEFITNGKYVDQSTTPVTVSVDDIVLDYDIDYEVTTGSTHVKLKGSFVSTLPVGTHTLKTRMDGYDDITTQFTITAAPSPTPDSDPTPRYKIPNTGVEGMPTNNHSLLKLSTLSIFSIGTYLVTKKKKDND